MSARDQLIARVLSNAHAMLKTNYDQSRRFEIWPGGSGYMDCSSKTYFIWCVAGYPLLGSNGVELLTSSYQINAVGFKLVWPDSLALTGKKFPSPKGLLSTYNAQAGDIVFWSFDHESSRPYHITHVGSIDTGGKQIIHISNNRDKCCVKPFSYGDGDVCAIIRLKEDFTMPAIKEIGRPVEGITRPEEWRVRMLQGALNLQRGEQLKVDGLFGPKVEAAVAKVNAGIGVQGGVCTAKTWTALGFSVSQVSAEPVNPVVLESDQPTSNDNRTVLRVTQPKLMRSDGIAVFQDGLTRLGYDTGGIDGKCGEKTMTAVRAFVAAHK